MRRQLRDEQGRAALVFVATLPFVGVAVLVAWQLVVVGMLRAGVAGRACGSGASIAALAHPLEVRR